MPLILGANSVSGGYEVDNSLRFNAGSTDYLYKNSWATATSDKIFTYSTWVKRSQLGSTERLFGAFAGSPQVYSCDLSFTSNNGYIEFTFGGANAYDIVTNAMFRDTSAWYHVVLSVDTTQATASNRIIIYVNGTVQTLQTANYPPQNTTYQVFRNNNANLIGSAWNGGAYYSGYMSETYFVDGQALTPSDFGEFDSDTNIWKPIPYTGSFGTNGFYLEFKDSSALGDDTSGNGNDFTVNNLTSIDQTTDTPTNNWCTLNPLDKQANVDNAVISEGNTVIDYGTASSVSGTIWGTIGVNTGKWYAEFNLSTYAGSSALRCGFNKFTITGSGANKDVSATGIFMVALDLINSLYWVGTNGVWDAGDPSAGTGGTSLTPSDDFYTIAVRDNSGTAGNGGTWKINTGNPAFTISSGNADANGYGNFEYAVPSGYYSLCTKNLAEYA